jgi:ribonucleotide reductase beta subunit family protein with ferritin-like domain
MIDHKKDMDKYRTEYELNAQNTVAELETAVAEKDANMEEVRKSIICAVLLEATLFMPHFIFSVDANVTRAASK